MRQSAFYDAFVTAIGRMCEALDESGKQTALRAIGFTTSDDLAVVGAFLLFDGDLPEDAERYMTLSPVEWTYSDEASFADVANLVESGRNATESEEDYEARIRDIFEACADATEALELRQRYANLEYVTFASVDPSPFFVEQEGRFVRRLNSYELWQAWRHECG